MRSNKIQYGTVALGEVGVWTGKDEGHHVRMGTGQRERHLIFDADHFVVLLVKRPGVELLSRQKVTDLFCRAVTGRGVVHDQRMLVSELNEERLDLGGTTNDSGSATIRCCPLSRSISLKTIHSEGTSLASSRTTTRENPLESEPPRRSHDVQDSFIVTQTQLEFRYHPLSRTSATVRFVYHIPRARTD